ncbi:DUF6954 family protein [Bacillus sp. FJAT-18017]|uniref:DUF6954 family protein n=1 Tax=Bacillus sp. FJAT-18017 TaxID=1705566 RepID=UPI000A4430F6|nr:hypothetical protein [Bacillus sp. FJAT-18017]
MKWLVHLVFLVLLGLLTFFGLGPVLMADGVWTERLATALIVLALYVLLGFLYKRFGFK